MAREQKYRSRQTVAHWKDGGRVCVPSGREVGSEIKTLSVNPSTNREERLDYDLHIRYLKSHSQNLADYFNYVRISRNSKLLRGEECIFRKRPFLRLQIKSFICEAMANTVCVASRPLQNIHLLLQHP